MPDQRAPGLTEAQRAALHATPGVVVRRRTTDEPFVPPFCGTKDTDILGLLLDREQVETDKAETTRPR